MGIAPLSLQPSANVPALNSPVQLGVGAASAHAGSGTSRVAEEVSEHPPGVSPRLIEKEADAGTDSLPFLQPTPPGEEGFSAVWASAIRVRQGQLNGTEGDRQPFVAREGLPSANDVPGGSSAQTTELSQGVGARVAAGLALRLASDNVATATPPMIGSLGGPFADAHGTGPHGSRPTGAELAQGLVSSAPAAEPRPYRLTGARGNAPRPAGASDGDAARTNGAEVPGRQAVLLSFQGIDGALGQIALTNAETRSAPGLEFGNPEKSNARGEVRPEALPEPRHLRTRGFDSQELAGGTRPASSDLLGSSLPFPEISDGQTAGGIESALLRLTEMPGTLGDRSLYSPMRQPTGSVGSADSPDTTSLPQDVAYRSPLSRGGMGPEQGAAFANIVSQRIPFSESTQHDRSSSTELAFQAGIRPKNPERTAKAVAASDGKVSGQRHATDSNRLAGSLRRANIGSTAPQIGETGAELQSTRAEWTQLNRETPYVAGVQGSSNPAAANATPRPAGQSATPPAAQLDTVRLDTGEFDTAAASNRPAGDVTVRLRSEGHGTANLRFSERAGEVQVTVRAADPQLVQSLRAGLDHLKSGLEMQGFQANVWSANSPSQPLKGSAESSLDTYHSADEDQAAHEAPLRDHSHRRDEEAEEWMDEID